jgi:hypothetical protein
MFVYCGVGINRYKPNMESEMKQRTTLKRARGQYNLLPNSTVQINLPNGDKLWLINTQGQDTTFVSLDISSESNLVTTVHDNKQYENYSTESVSVDSIKNGRLQTYCHITSFLHPSVIVEDPEITGRQDATTDDYWDCECEDNYINKKSVTLHCPNCNSREHEQPDSRVSEVESLLSDISSQGFSNNDSYDSDVADSFY